MSSTANALRASVRMGAVHGTAEERGVCASQMSRAAAELDALAAERDRLARELADERDEVELKNACIKGMTEQCDRLAALLREGVDNAEDFIGNDRGFPLQEWVERARAALTGAPANGSGGQP